MDDEHRHVRAGAQLSRPGGRLARIGAHGVPVTLQVEELWSRNVNITTGLVDTSSTPALLRLLQSRQVEAARFVTHHFPLDDFFAADDTLVRAAETGP